MIKYTITRDLPGTPKTLEEWSTHLAQYWNANSTTETAHAPTNARKIAESDGIMNHGDSHMQNDAETKDHLKNNNKNTNAQLTSIPISSFQHSGNRKNNSNNTPINNSINTVIPVINRMHLHTKIYNQSNLWITSDITQTVELHTTAWKLGMFIGQNYGSKNPINPTRFSLPLKYTDPNLLYN